MTFIKRPKQKKITIDLAGPDGNAFHLLGIVRGLAKQLNMDGDDIRKRMTCGDYENLIEVFDEEFGDYVDLIR